MTTLLNVTLDIDGIVAGAQFHSDPSLLMAAFPGLTDEQAFALVEGHASLSLDNKRVLYTPTKVH